MKALSGSYAVWMMLPLSAACQDVASYVGHPEFVSVCSNVKFVIAHMCVCACVRACMCVCV